MIDNDDATKMSRSGCYSTADVFSPKGKGVPRLAGGSLRRDISIRDGCRLQQDFRFTLIRLESLDCHPMPTRYCLVSKTSVPTVCMQDKSRYHYLPRAVYVRFIISQAARCLHLRSSSLAVIPTRALFHSHSARWWPTRRSPRPHFILFDTTE